MMRSLLLLLTSILFSLFVHAQNHVIRFAEDSSDFANPERGFYIPIAVHASHFIPLDSNSLKQQFKGSVKYNGANYTIFPTLLLREYVLDSFVSSPLSKELLTLINHDLEAVTAAGIKTILRFSYINKTHSGTCADKEGICPPYGDAPKQIVLEHIRQLEPLLKKHIAVIALLQEGFIGIWGENFYTDYFGDASENGPGYITDEGWAERNDVLKALLHALPKERMVQVRTPQIKQKYIGGAGASTATAPLNDAGAYSGMDAARIGFHNDCFLASTDDYGTYYDYGSSHQPKQPANDILRGYVSSDSRYVVVGGETCDDAFSPGNDCEPSGHAQQEMQKMHYSFLNTAYNNNVNNDWDSMGCISSIRKKLGYRIVPRKLVSPSVVKAGSIHLEMNLENQGYAAPFNPRQVILVLRKLSGKREFFLPLSTNLRRWFTGNIVLNENIPIPSSVSPGRYELFLFLPDADLNLRTRPAYSIRLAGKDCWEASTGYNRLNATIEVTSRR